MADVWESKACLLVSAQPASFYQGFNRRRFGGRASGVLLSLWAINRGHTGAVKGCDVYGREQHSAGCAMKD